MLHIHFSNRYEVLTRRLLEQLDARPAGVFAAEQLIVPSAAVRRSVTLAIARAQGVCANVAFSYLAPWLWRQMGTLLPGVAPESPFAPEVLGWRVHAALGDAGFVAAHPRLASYMGGADEVMRFELARRIAGLLDQYLTYRPDWLEAWQQGLAVDVGAQSDGERADERWQADLWQRLAACSVAPDSGPAFIEALKSLQDISPESAGAAGLPACAHVFALPTMPALHIAWLQQLGRLIDVHVYVLNPCQEYWFELIDRRRLSHLALARRADHQEEGNRLLAAWGRQTQAHVDGLVDSAGTGATDDAEFLPNEAGTLLARLQNAILELVELTPGSVALADDDRSIELHVCHSLTRELEVLQDHLLGLLASGRLRHPSEVLVVTPDLDAAAPLIDAVFGTAPRDRLIPYTVSGRARSTVNAPARALLSLLSLVASRFTAGDVFAALQQDIVARRFQLQDGSLAQVHEWLLASGTRWGLDASHRASFGVPGTAGHTWADGLDRLFLGYALPTDVPEPIAGLLPAGDAQGSEALALGRLQHFMSCLQALHAAVAVARPPSSWRGLLLDAVETFLAPEGDELEDLRELQGALRELFDAQQSAGLDDAGAHPLPLAVMRAALEHQLDDPARGGVPTGGVTFSSMTSLHGLPYAVVCVIGLNDGAFPTARRPPEFDLLALRPRRGDRQRRTDERNLFLDLLLAARGSLYLSHTGRSVRDNAPLPPSVLVSELLEVLTPAVAQEPDSAVSLAQARRRLVVEHPLQPFASAGFELGGDERLRSFNRELADALRASLQPGTVASGSLTDVSGQAAGEVAGEEAATEGGLAETDTSAKSPASDSADDSAEAPDDDDDEAAPEPLPAFFTQPLSEPGPEWRDVSVEQLVEFFANPSRYLLKHRLGIELGRAAADLQDDEPFLPDWPGRMALAARLLGPMLQGMPQEAVLRLAEAGHELPSGALGARQLARELDTLDAFANQVRALAAPACLPPHQVRLELDIDGEAWRLAGSFAGLRPDGLVRWRYDTLRPRDVLAAWIPHLALCAAPAPGAPARTVWLATDKTLRFGMPPDPAALLHDLVRLYRYGLREPLAFYPKAAWAYVENGDSMTRATQAWAVSTTHPHGESADPAYRLALRGNDDPLGQAFIDIARRVFGPAHAPQDLGD